MRSFCSILLLALFATKSHCKCYEPSPAFSVPTWQDGASDLLIAGFERIDARLEKLIPKYDTSSYSIEVTSKAESLWSKFHTAQVQDETRPGDQNVGPLSQYRIASITKTFTTLAILRLHQSGRLSLDDPVSKYIPELQSSDFKLPFKDITLRILASQLSGIPREIAQSDLINAKDTLPDPSVLGLPPASRDGLPTCDEYSDYQRPCNRTDFLDRLKDLKPLFAPNQKSTYSNVNYELLGLVIENVTGEKYEKHIKDTIFDPLNMSSASLEKPSDEHAVLPVLKQGENYWDVKEGIQNPTGGIYASVTDMSKFLRYILTHYNTIATGVNWFLPASWSSGLQTFYGMPWETFRTDSILEHSRRPVMFVTKSGGLPGYYSQIFLLEEYSLGITILVGGNSALLAEIRDIVTVETVRAAERAIWKLVDKTYSGSYIASASSLNSSVTLEASSSKGLEITSFISNGKDIYSRLLDFGILDVGEQGTRQTAHLQLVPTLLYKNETAQQGEIFRVLIVPTRTPETEERVWDAFCSTDDDKLAYAGKPLNEVVFWHEKKAVELTAWNVTLTLEDDSEKLVVQLDS